MRKESWSALLAVGALGLFGCAPAETRARFALPATALVTEGAAASAWSQAEITVEQLTLANLDQHRAYALRLTSGHDDESVLLPRVPLPAFALRIRNHGNETLFLGGATAWLSDAAGHRYELLTDREELARRALELAWDEQPLLMGRRLKQESMDPADRTSDAAVQSAARAIPLFGEGVQVPPRGSWSGALVVATDAEHLETLRVTLQSPEIVLHIEGGRAGGAAMPPLELAFATQADRQKTVQCQDGRTARSPRDCGDENNITPTQNGVCLQEGSLPHIRTVNRGRRAYIGGRAVSATDVIRVLRDRDESREHEVRAWRLKTAGWALIGSGGIGAATAVAGFSTMGNQFAPAGLGVLGVSAVGLGLLAVGHREHRLAVGRYNEFAFQSGLCARPL